MSFRAEWTKTYFLVVGMITSGAIDKWGWWGLLIPLVAHLYYMGLEKFDKWKPTQRRLGDYKKG